MFGAFLFHGIPIFSWRLVCEDTKNPASAGRMFLFKWVFFYR
ncbi:hypothetical Protein YC6258_02802 [Gynuella sunshinyii YC6258]|uniref:Uncharacterized protein n=1 Tax=Gynuella sunshinyii YC6258 TaxID=1445510 RepID=A0A0C5V5W4_9GAMM|nr:hypothetical Protein YC6258_02802 [Gynuella sunshinyii YC6258]